MRHFNKGKILDRKKQPREALLRNLAISLVLYEKIKTTEAKAKVLRPIVERLITIGKKNNLAARRQLLKYLYLDNAVKKILEVFVPRYQQKAGGYLRIIKLKKRQGDGAPIVQIEFV